MEVEQSRGKRISAKETLNNTEGLGKHGETKVLGLPWKLASDELEINLNIGIVSEVDDRVTKRTVLSSLAKVFDPLGLVSPVVAKAKSFFQELCAKKISWDEDLSLSLKEEWKKWEKDLCDTKVISVPRCIHPYTEEAAIYSLHVFGDASSMAYCAVIYLLCESVNLVIVQG